MRCPHGELLPEGAHGAKRVAVPEEVWDYFASVAGQVAGQEGSTPVFPATYSDCEVCAAHWSTQASRHEGQR